ncbi:MAG: hypothetical protein K0S29_624 [Gammaproteobacteria bacterium]|jgi:hypothetical protein|nr:hypothetical protein [Gammaproteobacteria bacterium]
MIKKDYALSITTQGPTYPPSEVMDQDGNFIVIGRLNLRMENGSCLQEWGSALVSADSPTPEFGKNLPYKIIKFLDLNQLAAEDDKMLCTLPLPLPCNNYPMVFAPEQCPNFSGHRPSLPFHQAYIPDLRPDDGRKLCEPVYLSNWIKASGNLRVSTQGKLAKFEFEFKNLLPNSLYTVMALREHDLDPLEPSRPGPLGVPNVFITDSRGKGFYQAIMPNAFPSQKLPFAERNRIINVVVLWMSTQMSYGGAIGHYGLGGDIHAQLKLTAPAFYEFET